MPPSIVLHFCSYLPLPTHQFRSIYRGGIYHAPAGRTSAAPDSFLPNVLGTVDCHLWHESASTSELQKHNENPMWSSLKLWNSAKNVERTFIFIWKCENIYKKMIEKMTRMEIVGNSTDWGAPWKISSFLRLRSTCYLSSVQWLVIRSWLCHREGVVFTKPV